MKVYALSRESFNTTVRQNGLTDENIEQKENLFCICIWCDKNDEKHPFYFGQEHKNVRYFYFYDIDKDCIDEQNNIVYPVISDETAEAIVKYIVENKGKKLCLVHCAAGISRSGAVATFINDLYGEPYREFIQKNSAINPNVTVLIKLRNAYEKLFPNG